MKQFLLLIFFTLLVSVSAQDKYELKVNDSGKAMLVGIIDREALTDTNFGWWFNSGYDNYDADSSALAGIDTDLDNTNITIVMGTWCSDSRREVPHFYKILDYLNYPLDKVELIAVDRDKNGLHNETEDLSIELVPTFIFYKDGEELGRIIESPEESLEKDFVKIINK